MHILILCHGSSNRLEGDVIRALNLPKVYLDVKAMPAGGLDAVPVGLPAGDKLTRSSITRFERKLLQNRGNAIVYTAYLLKKVHNKYTRLFANEIAGINCSRHATRLTPRTFGCPDTVKIQQSACRIAHSVLGRMGGVIVGDLPP